MRKWLVFAAYAIPLLAMTWLSSMHLPGSTKLASVASDGTQGNEDALSAAIAISGDGRFVAFESEASNLVLSDFNNAPDLFVHDQVSGETEIMPQGNNTYGFGQAMALSHNGRFVAFQSASNDLVPGDTNGAADVFVYDRETEQLERVSVSSDGEQANDHNFITGISANGRYVSFRTYADNLLPGVNTYWHTLIRDRETNVTLAGSVSYDGQPILGSGKISPDARYVVFHSNYAAVPEDTNGFWDVFVNDRWLGTTERVSVDSNGYEANDWSYYRGISANGRHVIFLSFATNLVPVTASGSQLYWHDRVTGETQLVSITLEGQGGIGNVFRGAISANGRFVTFNTAADNIVPNDTNEWPDVFIRDMLFGQTRLVSANLSGGVGNASSAVPDLSEDGRVVAFSSSASDLVAEDNNGFKDIFTRELWYPTLASNYAEGAPGSEFALSGTRSLVTSTITATVNGVSLGVVPVNADGSFAFQLATNQADPGRYTVGVYAPFADKVAVIDLDPAFPVRPPEGSGPIFEIPAGIAKRILYLPAVINLQ